MPSPVIVCRHAQRHRAEWHLRRAFGRVVAVGCAVIGAVAPAAGQSSPDGFNPGTSLAGSVRAVAVQPNGQILIGGDFTGLGGGTGTTPRSNLGRLNADGSVDAFFNPGANGVVHVLALQPDGKILVGGEFTTLGGGGTGTTTRNYIGRLNFDGSLDTTFDPGANNVVSVLAVQPDGKILVGGTFNKLGSGTGTTPRSYLGRLDVSGMLDAFNPGANGQVWALDLQPDGKILVGGTFTMLGGGGTGTTTRNHIGRLNADGTLDTFNPGANAGVVALAAQPDGKILVGGGFTMLGGGGTGTAPRFGIGRLNANGTVDTLNAGANGLVGTLAIQPDGKILVGGSFTWLGGGTPRAQIGRLNVNGSLDTTFDPGADNVVSALAVQSDGKILVGGTFTMLGGGGSGTTTRIHIGRTHSDGSLDAPLDPGANLGVSTLAVQPDGKILIGGPFTMLGGGGTGTTTRNRIGRLHPDGSLDAFNPGADSNVGAVAVQPDGKIVVSGSFTGLGGGTGTATARSYVGRLNADGTVDAAFNPGADWIVRALLVQPDGKIVVGGEFSRLGGGGTGTTTRWFLGRLNANGTLDTFHPGANGPVWTLALQEDGKIVVGGTFTMLGGGGVGTTTRNRIGRLNADGTLDTTFNPGADGAVRSLVLQADGKILVGGDFTTLGGAPRSRIGRLNADGTVDMSFDPGANGTVWTLAVDTGGQILAGGAFTTLGGATRNRIGRLHSSGAVDATFDPGANATVLALVVQSGQTLVGGSFTGLGGGTGTTPRSFIGRIASAGVSQQYLELESGAGALLWYRWGEGPEVDRATFERSTDGVTYAAMSGPVRVGSVSSSWILSSPGLPLNQNVYIRARGFYSTGLGNGSGSIVETVGQVYNNSAFQAPAITGHPVNQTVTVGAPVSFTASASGFPAPTYQWQVSTNGGASWAPVPSVAPYSNVFAATLTITAAPASLSGARYRAIASNSVGGVASGSALLTVELVTNGGFGSGTAGWLQFATPDMSYIAFAINSGVVEFGRVAPAPGTINQATIFQATGQTVPAETPLTATFQIGNTGPDRKYMKVLIVGDLGFADLGACTFWLEPNTPLTTFSMKTHTTQAASNLSIYFYASSVHGSGGSYLLDNISMQISPGDSLERTLCIDPFAPQPTSGAVGPNLVTNGSFTTGTLANWTVQGPVTSQINPAGNVLEFIRTASPNPPAVPPAVILQATGQAMTENQILTATFMIGNSSPVRKRVLLLVHDLTFGDLVACTWWLSPGQPLSRYVMRFYASAAWANATVAIYPATTGPDPWIRIDDITLQRTPALSTVGSECLEGSLAVGPEPNGPGAGIAPSGSGAGVARGAEPHVLQSPMALDLRTATSATLAFESWLTTAGAWGEVQVRGEDGEWRTVQVVGPSDVWSLVSIDLTDYAGQVVDVRFVLYGAAGAMDARQVEMWSIGEVAVDIRR